MVGEVREAQEYPLQQEQPLAFQPLLATLLDPLLDPLLEPSLDPLLDQLLGARHDHLPGVAVALVGEQLGQPVAAVLGDPAHHVFQDQVSEVQTVTGRDLAERRDPGPLAFEEIGVTAMLEQQQGQAGPGEACQLLVGEAGEVQQEQLEVRYSASREARARLAAQRIAFISDR
ncbi:MAG: hypothetical protein RBU45_11955 [Myxococcota bacterium]|jgi:hypothetical protein|nr:hypothetical protein [Myxococcota bacterium]